jgi:hypothetical protein
MGAADLLHVLQSLQGSVYSREGKECESYYGEKLKV